MTWYVCNGLNPLGVVESLSRCPSSTSSSDRHSSLVACPSLNGVVVHQCLKASFYYVCISLWKKDDSPLSCVAVYLSWFLGNRVEEFKNPELVLHRHRVSWELWWCIDPKKKNLPKPIPKKCFFLFAFHFRCWMSYSFMHDRRIYFHGTPPGPIGMERVGTMIHWMIPWGAISFPTRRTLMPLPRISPWIRGITLPCQTPAKPKPAWRTTFCKLAMIHHVRPENRRISICPREYLRIRCSIWMTALKPLP